ncbi:MAG TPA: bifunctional isocitrate dehydrogenase kinase/phosphatase [Steroidobacteraceae bacterium]|jgi:isocitrate dehydrogenase kinase/phosphatase|nr:bifunctional isocitrate dehydrogenase kinase/phosphatase [Steroidobacteraceae bacterium]
MLVEETPARVTADELSASRRTRAQGEIASAFESALYAVRCAQQVIEAFLHYNARFRSITRRAPERFLARDWHAAQQDAVERIDLYDQCIRETIKALELALGEDVRRRDVWIEVKRHFSNLIDGLPDSEFCKTFFSSVTRKLFGTVGAAADIEFIATDLDPLAFAHGHHTVTRAYRRTGTLPALLQQLLSDRPLGTSWRDLTSCVQAVAQMVEQALRARGEPAEVEGVEIIDAVFYQATRAYVVGRVVAGGQQLPLALALRNGSRGLDVDATILDEDELSILFGIARSYFHVDLERVAEAVAFLKELMPRKPAGELFTILGRAKQGKTERYRSLMRHLLHSRDEFVHAPGERGLVMICFTMPSFDVVFKVIREHIPAVKDVWKKEVMAKYAFVFRHDRAGRLIDAQEFRRLRFPMARFAAPLLEELLAEAGDSVHVEGTDLIFDHLYIERRLIPLNIYLRSADESAAVRAVLDYGQAIRDLAVTNVFPGDLLLKNFGVTRHGRVIFYDYDELCRLTDCSFRDLPTASCDEDEMSAEPWFYVGDKDVFPETFPNFLGMVGAQRAAFLKAHRDLFEPAFWRRTQQRLNAGEILEVLPYSPAANP